MKGNRKFMIVLALALALVIYAEATAPRPIDWSPSYSRNHKIPYGAFALYELFLETLPPGTIQTSDETIYSDFNSLDVAVVSSYVIINDEFTPDELDRETLLDYVELGNTALIAANRIDESFLDSLGAETEDRWLAFQGTLDQFMQRDTVHMNFASPSLRADSGYPVRVGSAEHWFTTLDSATTTILGQDENGRPNFIRVRRGLGSIYVSVVARAFTNINVLADRNHEYVFKALSYLPRQKTIWSEYYKTGRRATGSPLGYILNSSTLRGAWYSLLIGVVLFVFVYSRRRQRAIPVVKPPTNTSLEFTETVGRLYFQNGDHRGIAEKKVAYFNEYLRSRLGIRVGEAERDTHRRIAERSGVPEELVIALFSRIHHMRRARDFDATDLRSLNADLERFYTDSKR